MWLEGGLLLGASSLPHPTQAEQQFAHPEDFVGVELWVLPLSRAVPAWVLAELAKPTVQNGVVQVGVGALAGSGR